MSGFTDFFQPTPIPGPRPAEPPGFDLLRDMLLRKIFSLQANPYGLSGQTAQNPMGGPHPFFSTGPNMNAPALQQAGVNWGTSGGVPTQDFNPAFSQLGGARRMDAAPAAGRSPVPGQRVPLHSAAHSTLQNLLRMKPRHFDGGIPAPTPTESPNQMPGPQMRTKPMQVNPWLSHIHNLLGGGTTVPRMPVEAPQTPGMIAPAAPMIQHNANGGYGNWGGVGQTPASGGFHPHMQDFSSMYKG